MTTDPPETSSGDPDEGLSTLALVLVVILPCGLLLLSLVPETAAHVAGGAGRVVVQSRVLFAALALAIWVGVLVSMVLGGAV